MQNSTMLHLIYTFNTVRQNKPGIDYRMHVHARVHVCVCAFTCLCMSMSMHVTIQYVIDLVCDLVAIQHVCNVM